MVEPPRDAADYSAELSRWVSVPPPASESKEGRGANWSRVEWKVYEQGGRAIARRLERQPRPTLNDRNSYRPPFQINVFFAADGPVLREPHTRPNKERISRDRLAKVEDGWLFAANGGEWGGAIWWFAPDGSRHYKVSDDQVGQFHETTAGLLATEGLAHMGLNHGKVIRLKQSSSGKWVSEKFASLDAAPAVSLLDRDGSLLIASFKDLVRVRMNGQAETLLPEARVCWKYLYPGSMIVLPSGDIFLGMRFAVTRLRKTVTGYEPFWLIPDKAYWKTIPNEP
jgi:hypothetical protein